MHHDKIFELNNKQPCHISVGKICISYINNELDFMSKMLGADQQYIVPLY
jgi:hypothetical protein